MELTRVLMICNEINHNIYHMCGINRSYLDNCYFKTADRFSYKNITEHFFAFIIRLSSFFLFLLCFLLFFTFPVSFVTFLIIIYNLCTYTIHKKSNKATTVFVAHEFKFQRIFYYIYRFLACAT